MEQVAISTPKTTARRDIVVLTLVSLAVVFGGIYFDAYDRLNTLARQNPQLHLTDVFYALRVAAIAIAIFALRRWGELQAYTKALGSSEQTRRGLEARYSSLIDQMQEGVVQTDSDDRIHFANDRFCEISGYSREELRGQVAGELFLTQEDREALSGVFQQRAAGMAVRYEIPLIRKDGQRIWVSISASSASNLDGRGIGHLRVISDISDRKQAEAEQEKTVSLLTATLESTADGILVMDKNGAITSYNRRFTELWRVPSEVMTTRDRSRLLQHMLEQLVDIESFLDRLEAADFSQDGDFDHLNLRDGRVFESYCRPQRSGGEVIGRVWSFRDDTERSRAQSTLQSINVHLEERVRERTTQLQAINQRLAAEVAERQRAQEALAESEERWSFALEGSGDGVWDRDFATGIVFYSRRWKEMLGFEEREIGSAAEEWISRIHPDDRPHTLAEAARHHRGETPLFRVEYRMLCKDGSYRWILCRGKALTRDAAGKVIRMVGTHTDISQRKESETALVEAHQFTNEIIASAGEGIAVYDRDLRYVVWNPAMEQLTGVNAGQVLGKRAPEVFPNVFRRGVMRQFEQALAGEKVHAADAQFTIPETGKVGWASSVYGPHRNAAGEIVGVIGVFSDVSQRREIEDALRQTNHFVQQVTATTPDIIFVFDIVQQVSVYSNRQSTPFLGYAPEETARMGSNLLASLVHPEDLPRLAEHYQRFGQAGPGDVLSVEYRIRAKNGDWHWFESRDTLFKRTPDGKPQQILGVSREITEQKRYAEEIRSLNAELERRVVQRTTELQTANQEIRTSERRLRQIIDLDPSFIFSKDTNGRFLMANKAVADFLGTTVEAIVGKTDSDFLASQEEIQRFRDDDISVIRSGRVKVTPEQTLTSRSGQVRLVQTVKIPFTFSGATTPAILGISTDITELKRAEMEIRKFNEALEERVRQRTAELTLVNRELESFSYSVSHDLRAPLRAIDGFSRTLADSYRGKLDESGLHYLTRIRAAAQRMGQLIDDLLQLSRVTRSELRRTRADLSTMASEIANDLRNADPNRKAEFVITPGLTTNADPNLLRIVLDNLLGNAWKFTSKHPTARIEFGATEYEGRLAFYVRDDGAGFDAAHKEHLFGPFQRLHRADEFAGTGIGLATVHRIIERHGGKVWADGEIEKGATVYFTLGANV